MVCQYSEEIVACLKVTIYYFLGATIPANSILPSNCFELQLPIAAVTTVYFLNSIPNGLTFGIKTTG